MRSRTSKMARPDGPDRAPANRAELELQLERLHAASFGWALACCGRKRDDAQDVLQTSYLKVLEGRAEFAGRSSFKTWLFGVIRLTAAEQRRWWLLQRLGLLRLREREPASAHNPGPDEDAVLGQQARTLVSCLQALPRRQREVIELVFYHEYSIAEAAEVMGVSLGSARQHYERGKHRLLDELGRMGVTAP